MQAGEVANSARAITSVSLSSVASEPWVIGHLQEILLKLYHHNHLPENWTVRAYRPGERTRLGGLGQWGGGRVRRLLQAAYTVAFLCMLRFDEVLKIQVHDLHVCKDEPDEVVLHLPFRKTHQHGGM